jgi:hypothetical protein
MCAKTCSVGKSVGFQTVPEELPNWSILNKRHNVQFTAWYKTGPKREPWGTPLKRKSMDLRGKGRA